MRWIRNRFETDEWAGWVVATLFASFIIPAAVVTLGIAWAVVVEIVRLGNEHVGDRARVDGLRASFLVVLGFGIAAVWIASGIAGIRKRAGQAQRATPLSGYSIFQNDVERGLQPPRRDDRRR